MKHIKRLILASTSPYRRKQLTQLDIDFDWVDPSVDETPELQENAIQLAHRLATAKASKILREFPASIVIGCDQTAEHNHEILGKPIDEANAIKQLQECSGHSVSFYSGICVASSELVITEVIITEVEFLELSPATIREYITRESPLNCAGSFKCEGLGIALFESISSKDPSALVGLPLIALNRMLKKHGVFVLGDN